MFNTVILDFLQNILISWKNKMIITTSKCFAVFVLKENNNYHSLTYEL